MIKLKIDPWKLRELGEKHPIVYDQLRENDSSLPDKEKLKDSWSSFECFININHIDDVPGEVLEVCTFERLKSLTFHAKGSIYTKDIKQALAQHQVYLPDNLLLKVREVQVLENACTDDLQRMLDEDWAIISVCPQPGQRRPDYVLGRTRGAL